MNIYILLSLACVFVSIKAADICGIPKIKPVFHPTLNNDELGNIVGGYEAVPHSFPWMVRLLQSRLLHCILIILYIIYTIISSLIYISTVFTLIENLYAVVLL